MLLLLVELRLGPLVIEGRVEDDVLKVGSRSCVVVGEDARLEDDWTV